MARTMHAIVWDGNPYPGGLSLRDFEVPALEPGWALVNTKAAGICGSDLHLILGELRHVIPDRNLPAVLGHENAGVVAEVGPGVTRFRPGDRVAVEPLHGCTEFGGGCPMCHIGKYQLCRAGLTAIGNPVARMLPGGFGEFCAAHESRLFPLPEHVSMEDAALLDILAVCVHALNVAQPSLGQTALVMGCGVVGLDLVQCLRARGIADLIAVARHEFQAEAARRLGARDVVLLQGGVDVVKEVATLTAGHGVDIAYECVGGDSDAVDQCLAMCTAGGTVVMLGCAPGHRPIDLEALLRKEARILASQAYSTSGNRREFEVGLSMLSDRLIDHRALVTHRFAPEQYLQGFDAALHKGKNHTIKVLFERG